MVGAPEPPVLTKRLLDPHDQVVEEDRRINCAVNPTAQVASLMTESSNQSSDLVGCA